MSTANTLTGMELVEALRSGTMPATFGNLASALRIGGGKLVSGSITVEVCTPYTRRCAYVYRNGELVGRRYTADKAHALVLEAAKGTV